MKTKNRTVLVMTEISILSALSLALDALASATSGFFFPDGGSIGIAMIPIMVISFRRGIVAGLTSGFIVGMIQVLWGGHFLEFTQYILDYPVAYTVVGLAGIFTYLNNRRLTVLNVIMGSIFAGLMRYLSHFFAGVFFWGEYMQESFDFLSISFTGLNVYTYSLVYNGSYMIPTIIINTIVIYVLYKYAKQIFIQDIRDNI
ncbi:MAG TPA: energy-coupled thiamine transporter ThiT [Bacilli bacterium]